MVHALDVGTCVADSITWERRRLILSTRIEPTQTVPAQGSPIHQLPEHDYGAETLRNYEYQAAYGVVLLVGAAARRNDYIALWCEQEDDFLGQISERLFDSFQVKTQAPELGYWTITDDAFVSAVKTFLRLNRDHAGYLRRCTFVSNTECLESRDKKKAHLCPKRLAAAATACFAWEDLDNTGAKGFETLQAKIGHPPEDLFQVLKKLVFAKGPSRESFIAELAQNHLRELEWCRLTQPRLEAVVRSLIELIAHASSLLAQDPARHYACLNDGQADPQLLAKRITVEDFILRTRELGTRPFQYLPSLTSSPLARTNRDLKRFSQKLKRGALSDYADSLRKQTLSAEAEFLELATRGPEGSAKVVQVEGVVQQACDEAHLRTRQGKKSFGQRMLIDVQDRLLRIAKDEPQKVHEQPYEALLGMAGLLTENCTVWWSERFNPEDA
jgi:Cap4, dsDNA endonuclease domain